jgi:hypothetical protein
MSGRGLEARADFVFQMFHIGVIRTKYEPVRVANVYFQSAIPSHYAVAAWTTNLGQRLGSTRIKTQENCRGRRRF